MPEAASRLLRSLPREDVFYSVASLWEVGIKSSLNRLGMSPEQFAGGLEKTGATRLAIELDHVIRVSNLPFHHKDPFDRILIAQAEVEPLRLLTSDRRLALYGSIVMVV